MCSITLPGSRPAGAVAALLLIVSSSLSGCADSQGESPPSAMSDSETIPGDSDSTTNNSQATSTISSSYYDRTVSHEGFAGADQCTACHDGLVDANGNSVDMTQDWSSSMMANAARDPYWIARVAAEALPPGIAVVGNALLDENLQRKPSAVQLVVYTRLTTRSIPSTRCAASVIRLLS